jgi:hypothetical protein
MRKDVSGYRDTHVELTLSARASIVNMSIHQRERRYYFKAKYIQRKAPGKATFSQRIGRWNEHGNKSLLSG